MNKLIEVKKILGKFYKELKKEKLPIKEIIVNEGIIKVKLIVSLLSEKKPFVITIYPKKNNKYQISYEAPTPLDNYHQSLITKFSACFKKYANYLPDKFKCSIIISEKDLYSFINYNYQFVRIDRIKEDNVPINEVLVRVTSKCNQKCPFCSAPPTNYEPTLTQLKECYEKINKLPINSTVALTGGEPTLRKDLIEQIDYLNNLEKIKSIQIQTNAVIIGLASTKFQFPLYDKLKFFVSLHGLDTKIYELCTGVKKQLPYAINGIKELQKQNQNITLNCVINKFNIEHLEDYILSIPKIFANNGAPPEVHFSIMICPEYRERIYEFLIQYSLVASKLEKVVKLAKENNIRIAPLINSTYASIPACVLKEELRKKTNYPIDIVEQRAGYEDFTKPWVKARVCQQCKMTSYCMGLPKPYAIKFGFSELNPISR